MQEIRLPAATPRDLDAIKRQLDLRKGLYAGYGFGAAFLAGAVLLPLAVLLLPHTGPVLAPAVIGPLFFAGLAMFFLLPARHRRRARTEAFVHGALVTARVTGQRRAWVAYSSFRDYLIDAEARLADGRVATGTIRTRSERFAESLPVGTELQALAPPDSPRLFLPMELGMRIVPD